MGFTAMILFAHGAKDPRWEGPVRSLAQALSSALPDVRISVAFLQFGEPKLGEVFAELAKDGASKVVVMPYFLAAGGHLLRDLPNLIDQAKAEYPYMTIESAAPLGEHKAAIEGLKRACVEFLKKSE